MPEEKNYHLKQYVSLLKKLKRKFKFVSFKDFKKTKCICLRHDIDFCLNSALKIAKIENKLKIKANYFFLSSYYYDLNSKNSKKIINQIDKLGHYIALHWDLSENKKKFVFNQNILKQNKNFQDIISIHKPPKKILGKKIKNIKHTYEKRFFNIKTYFSDSKGNVNNLIDNFDRINTNNSKQILMHPFWYVNPGASPIEKMIKFHKKNKFNISYLKKNYNIQ